MVEFIYDELEIEVHCTAKKVLACESAKKEAILLLL
jgi:hypothetical protein